MVAGTRAIPGNGGRDLTGGRPKGLPVAIERPLNNRPAESGIRRRVLRQQQLPPEGWALPHGSAYNDISSGSSSSPSLTSAPGQRARH